MIGFTGKKNNAIWSVEEEKEALWNRGFLSGLDLGQLLPFADGASRHWELEDGTGALHLFNGASLEFCRIHGRVLHIWKHKPLTLWFLFSESVLWTEAPK